MRPIEVTAQKLSRNARESMRDCALNFRRARKQGEVLLMVRWLQLAVNYRRIAAGFLEAA